MKLIIREYLSLLKESGELDNLMINLLPNMGIDVISKPEKGVRQYGVDIAAIGTDPNDSINKLFLFVLKQGNLDRTNWDNGPQSIRQSINEIIDVYVNSHIHESHKNLPINIVVCCNGNIQQSVHTNWTQFCNTNAINNKRYIDFWNADRLSGYINEYLMNEFLFPEKVQKDIRKTLAFIDLDDYDLSHFYNLTRYVLDNVNESPIKEKLSACRLLNLCLNILFKWCAECNNLKPALIGSERVVLTMWNWMYEKSLFNDKKIVNEFLNIYYSYVHFQNEYYSKTNNHFYVEDGLFGYGNGAENIEYQLITFEQLGLLSLIGLNQLTLYDISKKRNFLKNSLFIVDAIYNLIKNNRISSNVQFDGQNVEITLVTLLFFYTKKSHLCIEWIEDMQIDLVNSFVLRKKFPLLSDSYDELMYIDLNLSDQKEKSSTLLPILAELSILLNSENLFNSIKNSIESHFKDLDLQIWYPDENIEKVVYKNDALRSNGLMRTSIQIPNSFSQYKLDVKEELLKEIDYTQLSFCNNQFPVIVLIASRHFRTQVFPFFWRRLIE